MKIILLTAIIVVLLTSLFNRKLNVFKVIIEQFSIYKNDKTKKCSKYDIFTFFISPLIASILLSFLIDLNFILERSELFITILSIISTILFSFLALLIEKRILFKNDKANQVSNETYISIIMTILYSLIAIIIMIGLLLVPTRKLLVQIFSIVIYYFAIKIILNILMIFSPFHFQAQY